MKWTDLSEQQCSVARSSSVLGDRWTLLILCDCFLGVRRFEDFQQRLGLSRTTLANRLQLLEDHEILSRIPYQEKPTRYEYRFTEKGLALYPIITSVVDWGDKYYADAAGPPIIRQHTTCGHDFHSVSVCSECGEAVDPHEVVARKRSENSKFSPVLRGPIEQD